jgi:hypothetical protein
MSQAEKQALALRDLAVRVVMAKGIITASDLYSYHDARIRIDYSKRRRCDLAHSHCRRPAI